MNTIFAPNPTRIQKKLFFIYIICLSLCFESCNLLDVKPETDEYYYLLERKSEMYDFGGTVTNSDTYYEYDTTSKEPVLIAQYDDNNNIEYEYISSNHILANYLDYEGNTYRFVDYYLDANTKNVIRQVLNDTLIFAYKYDEKGYLTQDPYTPELVYEYENGNLVRKKYNIDYQEELEYYPLDYVSPFVAFQFGLPSKNILKSIRSKFKNEEGVQVLSEPLTYNVERDEDGLVISEEVNLDNFRMRTEYSYVKVKKK